MESVLSSSLLPNVMGSGCAGTATMDAFHALTSSLFSDFFLIDLDLFFDFKPKVKVPDEWMFRWRTLSHQASTTTTGTPTLCHVGRLWDGVEDLYSALQMGKGGPAHISRAHMCTLCYIFIRITVAPV
jgi:hypothetical protein